MSKYISALLLVGLVSMMLCGFINEEQANHAFNHLGSETVEQHLSMWAEMSIALVSNVATSVATLISIIVLTFFVTRSFTSFLSTRRLVYDWVLFDPHKALGKRSKFMRWLSLFENSPSLA